MQVLSDNIAGQISDTRLLGARAFAALSLIAANIGLLVLYFVLDLTLFQLVVVYWWEALWIGLFSGLKLLTASLFARPYDTSWLEVSPGANLFLSLYAIVKAGGFFLILLALTGLALIVSYQELTGTDGEEFIAGQLGVVLKCSLLFLVGHGLSFVVNFLVLGEFRQARFITLLWLPFKRAFALFFAIVASLTAIQTWPGMFNETVFAGFLIFVKLAWDYRLHRRERRSLQASPANTAEGA